MNLRKRRDDDPPLFKELVELVGEDLVGGELAGEEFPENYRRDKRTTNMTSKSYPDSSQTASEMSTTKKIWVNLTSES